jgi:hypothetical protein
MCYYGLMTVCQCFCGCRSDMILLVFDEGGVLCAITSYRAHGDRNVLLLCVYAVVHTGVI